MNVFDSFLSCLTPCSPHLLKVAEQNLPFAPSLYMGATYAADRSWCQHGAPAGAAGLDPPVPCAAHCSEHYSHPGSKEKGS